MLAGRAITARAEGKVVSYAVSEAPESALMRRAAGSAVSWRRIRSTSERDVAGSVLRHPGSSERAEPCRLLDLGLPQSAHRKNGIGARRRREREGEYQDGGQRERRDHVEAAHQNLPGGSSV